MSKWLTLCRARTQGCVGQCDDSPFEANSCLTFGAYNGKEPEIDDAVADHDILSAAPAQQASTKTSPASFSARRPAPRALRILKTTMLPNSSAVVGTVTVTVASFLPLTSKRSWLLRPTSVRLLSPCRPCRVSFHEITTSSPFPLQHFDAASDQAITSLLSAARRRWC